MTERKKMHSRTEKIDLNDLSRSMKQFDFSHMDLSEKSFIGEDLEFADFEGADLSFADFTAANLRCANLKKARLYGTIFSNADMKFADIREATLEWAHFTDTKLDYANLSGALIRNSFMNRASIEYTSFVGANIESVNLEGTKADHADFKNSRITEINNPPFQPMACPSHGAFTGWAVGHRKIEDGDSVGTFIELIIPEDAIRISNYNNICRTNKAIVKSIRILHTYDYVDRNSYRASDYEYTEETSCDSLNCFIRKVKIGETLTDEIDFNRFNGTKGIQFWIDKDVAIKQALYMSEP